MPSNVKFHLMAVIGIIAAVVFVFYASGQFDPPPPPPKPEVIVKSPYKVIVDEASWGMNCAKFIDKKMAGLKKDMSRATGSAYDKLQEEMDAIIIPERNNAKELIAEHCKDQVSCELYIAPDGIDLKTPAHCQYWLELTYRCYGFDKLREARARSYEKVTVDCSDPKI